MNAEQLLVLLISPNVIGTTVYRAVYDCVDECVRADYGDETPDARTIALDTLGEIVAEAEQMRQLIISRAP